MPDPIEVLEQILATAPDGPAKIDALNTLAWELRNTDQPRAAALSEEAKQLSRHSQPPYFPGLADSLRTLARLAYGRGLYHECLTLAFEGLALVESLSDATRQPTMFHNIAIAYSGLGNYPEALSYFLQSLKLCQDLGDRWGEADTLNGLAILYDELGNSTEALSHYQAIHQIYQDLGDDYGLARTLNNMAFSQFNSGNLTEALPLAEESLHLSRKTHDKINQMAVLDTLGAIYLAQEDYGQAISHFQQALQLAETLDATADKTEAWLNLARCQQAQGDIPTAVPTASAALALAAEIQNGRQQIECHHLLAELHEQAGDLAAALAHHKQFYALQKEVYGEESNNRVQGLLLQHQTEIERQVAEVERRKNEELRQLVSELAILNSVGEAMAQTLDVKTITRIVGDKIVDIFQPDAADILLLDRQTNLIHAIFGVEAGQYDEEHPPFPLGQGMTSRIIQSRQPLRLGTFESQMDLGGIKVDTGIEEFTQSYLGVPIIVGEQVLGVVAVHKYPQNAFGESDMRLLQTLSANMGVAIENARLFEAEQQRVNELAILNSVGEAMAQTLDVKTITRIVGDKVRDIFKAEIAAIMLLDAKTNLIHDLYSYDVGEGGYVDFIEPFPLGTGLTSRVIQTRQPLLVSTTAEQNALGAYMPPEQDFESGIISESWLGVPILVSDKVIGIVNISDYQPHAYDEGDVRLLQTLSANMGVAIENARLFEAEQERVAELQVINSIQHGLAAELDFQGIVDLVGDKLREVLNTDNLGIRWYDPVTNLTHYLYEYEHGERLTIPSAPPIKGGLWDKMVETRQPVILNTLAEQLALGIGVIPGTDQCLASVYVPIIGSDRVIGSIVDENHERENAYSESDVRLLQTIANSMGVALENARLFAETQRLLKETEERNAELAVINSVQQGLAAELEFQAIIDLVGDKLRDVFNTPNLGISWYEPSTNLMHVLYAYEHGQRLTVPAQPPSPEGNFQTFIKTRQPIIQNTLEEIIKVTGGSLVPGTEQARSAVYVPIISSDRVLGIVDIENHEREYAFGESEVRLLTTIAASLGTALENARLFAETQRLLKETEQRAQELAIINSVGEAMSKQLDTATIIRIVGDNVTQIFKADATAILMLSPDGKLITPVFEWDDGHYIDTVEPFPLGTGLTSHVINTRRPLTLGTAAEAAELGAYYPPEAAAINPTVTQSYLGVPIIVGQKIIGVVSAHTYTQHAYNETSVRLLSTIANNMGVALENARLFDETKRLLEETRQRTAELATVNTVSQAIATELELEALIALVGDQIRQAFSADIAYVALLNRQTNIINFPYTYGEALTPLPYGEGLTSKIIQTGQPLLLNEDVDKQTTALGASLVGVESQSYLGVPINVARESIGALSVQSLHQEGRFDEADMRLLGTIAANVGAALQNAQLYQETQRRATEMAALTEVGREISATLDLDVVLERIASHARNLLHAEHSAVFLPEPGGQTFKASVALGDIAPQLKAMTVQLGRGIIGDVARRGEAEIVNNAQHDPRVIHIEDTPETDAEHLLVAPLLSGQQVMGIMVVWRIGAGLTFVESELTFLIGLARQATIALQNARLFEEAEVARQEAEHANLAKSAFLATMSHELRTPLNAIIGFSKIVKRKATGVLPDKQVDNLDKVLVSAEHLLGLINTILDIAKIEAGHMDVTPGEFNVENLVEMCSLTAQPLLRPGVELVKEIDSGLPLAYSDQDKIKQILLNLLSNAAKFTHQGNITLRVRSKEYEVGSKANGEAPHLPTPFLILDVIDSGIGISPEALSRVFEEFQQADNSTTRQYGGTGLGLSISRKLAHLLGGDLTVTSVEGEGSTFTLTVPLRFGESALPLTPSQKEGEQKASPPLGGTEGGLVSASADHLKPLILAIDDHTDVIDILRENLGEAGYRVIGVHTAKEGLAKARELRPAAITLDIILPDQDGWQVLYELKQDPATRDIPVIMLTIIDKKAMGLQLGAVDYLIKPLDSEALLATLSRLTKANGGTPPKHLLVVDDDPNVREMVSQLLESQSINITTAADGVEALAAIEQQPPDAILLDLMMPRLDGFGVLARLRQTPAHRAIPVVVITAKLLSAAELATLQQSTVQIIQKQGLSGETLVQELQKIIST